MNVQEITKRLLVFCENQYPNLKWNVNNECTNETVICGVDFPFEVTLKIHSNKRDESFLYKEEVTYDAIIGQFDLVNVCWVGVFGIVLNCDKKIDFRSFPITEWDKKDWDLHKKYREVMLGIFNFIVNEIQE